MKTWKKTISLFTVSAMLFTSSPDAAEYCADSGCAYESSCKSCCVAPAIAFVLLAIAGVIAINVDNRGFSSHARSSNNH